MASPAPAVELWVKGDPATETLLDCERQAEGGWGSARVGSVFGRRRPSPSLPGPFCHRVLLVAGEKAVPHTLGYIDFAAKPEWLPQVNPAGSVPVAKDLSTGAWIVDSAVIADWLEEKWPQPALGKTADSPAACVVGGEGGRARACHPAPADHHLPSLPAAAPTSSPRLPPSSKPRPATPRARRRP
jgi:glutathione S-transferase